MTRTLTGTKILLWLLGTFGVVFAVNGLFIAKAVSTYPGEDVSNPYLQGIDYNRTLSDRAVQAANGWHATISGARTANGRVTISIIVSSRETLPAGFSLVGELRHPADAERDHKLRFVEPSPGTFVGQAAGVTSGAWDVVVRTNSRVPFEASRRLWLR